MKHALLAASLVLVGVSAVACGGGDGGDGAPSGASKEDFCDSYNSLFTDLSKLGGTSGEMPDEDAMLKSFKSWAEKMEDVGTPKDLSDDGRKGFELAMEQVGDLEASDLSEGGLESLTEDLSDAEQKQSEALTTYITENCGNPLEDIVPSEPAS